MPGDPAETAAPARRRLANVLDEDSGLLEAVAPDRRRLALQYAFAPLLKVPVGAWDARTVAEAARDGHGLLLLAGMLVRRVGLGERIGAELLGPGDLLRPLEHDGEEATLPFASTWRVLEPLRLAVLDRAWSFRMGAFPEVSIALTARAIVRSRRLANTIAIMHHPRLDERLRLLLWELADRFGKVSPDGVRVPVPATHDLLSELAGARRPSVSLALGRLANAGLVERARGGWVLHGEPPAIELAGRTEVAHEPVD